MNRLWFYFKRCDVPLLFESTSRNTPYPSLLKAFPPQVDGKGIQTSHMSTANGDEGLAYLVLEHGAPEGPDGGEDKVELVELLSAVGGRVLRGQQTLQQVAQRLHQALLRHRDDLLEPGPKRYQTSRLVREEPGPGLDQTSRLERKSVSQSVKFI